MTVVGDQVSGVRFQHEPRPTARQKTLVGIAVGALLFALGLPADAQQQAKIPKIGALRAQPASSPASSHELFLRTFRELGYVEGKNIAYETRSAQGKVDRFPTLAEELVRQKPDVVFASSTTEALTFKGATRTIPIIFHVTTDPVADGLVDSLARPGGNITGVTTLAALLAGKRLELLKETIPKILRVAVLRDPKGVSATKWWKETQLAAQELGLQLHSMEVSTPDKFEEAFRGAAKAQSAALSVSPGSLNTANPKLIADLATKYKLPAIFDREDFIASGGLMSYGPDRAEGYRRAAVYVDKILKGTKPADLPVEQPMKFEFIINLKAAQQIGLTIPPNVLARADRVVK
jgi:putative tryptophan/tyrosine transport system substrate-binding protein